MKTYLQFIKENSAEEFKSELSNKLKIHQQEQKQKSKDTSDIDDVKVDTTDKIKNIKDTTDLVDEQGKKINDKTQDIKKDLQLGKDSEEIQPKIDELEKELKDFDEIITTAKDEADDIIKDNEK